MVHVDGPVGLDGVAVGFDDERAVADAGIVLVATLAQRLGIEALVDERVDLGERAGRGNEGAKVMTLVSAMALGADCIDDCDVLRAGPHRRRARPPGDGAVDAGHVPARVHVRARPPTRPRARRGARRAWAAGAGPGDGRLVVDVDSFVGEVFGREKQGAAFGYTRVRGYHPILATRADTGEVLHIRLGRARRTPRAGCGASPTS